MRLVSAATEVPAVALFVALLLGDASETVQLAVQVSALGSGMTFALGFSPPSALRVVWRRTEERHLHAGMLAALRAGTVDEVASALLPPTVRIVGGCSAALVDDRGRVMATCATATSAPGHGPRGPVIRRSGWAA
jgi:hypothetical protein